MKKKSVAMKLGLFFATASVTAGGFAAAAVPVLAAETHFTRPQNVRVEYIDQDSGTVLEYAALTGEHKTRVDYSTASVIRRLSTNYNLVKDGFPSEAMYDDDSFQDQLYTVTFSHKQNALPAAMTTKTVKRTIHFIMADVSTEKPEAVQEKVFTRNGYQDAVTKDIVTTSFSPEAQEFPEYTIPEESGYKAYVNGKEATKIDPELVTAQSRDEDIYVFYSKNPQQYATVSIVDDSTGDTDAKRTTLASITVTGTENTLFPDIADTVGVTKLAELQRKGYDVVSNDYGKASSHTFDDDTTSNQNIVIHVTPHIYVITAENAKSVNDQRNEAGDKYPEGLEKENLATSVTRTIKYIYDDTTANTNEDNEKAAEDVAEPLDFTRTASVNKVTGEVSYSKWAGDKTEFSEVKSPEIKGYTASQAKVDAEVIVDAGAAVDTVQYITYIPQTQKAVISYVGKDDKLLADDAADTIEGKTKEVISYSTKDRIKSFTDKGYQLVEDKFPTDAKDLVFDDDDTVDQTYKVVLEPVVETITNKTAKTEKDQMNPNGDKYPAGLSEKDLTKEIKRTIHFVDKDGKPMQRKDENGKLVDMSDQVETVTYTRDAKVNHADGTVTYGEWKTEDAVLKAVKIPEVNGYKADKETLDAVETKSDTKDIEEKITYTAVDNKSDDKEDANKGTASGTASGNASSGTASGTASGKSSGSNTISQSGKGGNVQTSDASNAPYLLGGISSMLTAAGAFFRKKKRQ